MNLLFKFSIFVGCVIVIGLFTLLIAPYFIKWEEFTGDFEREVSRIVGQEVSVEGQPKVRILPLPSVSFEDISVGRNEDGTPLMNVERFAFTAELFPFLSGEVRIVDITMINPTVNLQVSEQGTIAWTKPAYDLVDPEQVQVDNLSIERGSIIVSGLAGGRTLKLENIGAQVSARSILGPWRIDAKADVEGVPSDIRIATGTYQPGDRSLRLKIETSQVTQPYVLEIDGPLKLKNEALFWSGDFALKAFSRNRVSEMLTPVEPLPIAVEGLFEASPKQISVTEYRLDVGDSVDPYTITGEGSIDIAENVTFRANADGRQIDLDRISKEQTDRPNSESNIHSRLAVLNSVLERVPIPAADGIVDVKLPAVVAGDTFIRDISARVKPFGKSWDIDQFTALFPGNTVLEASGRLGLAEDFGFSGNMLLASRQPSGFATWFTGEVDDTLRRMQRFGLSAEVQMSKRQISLENLEMRLDDALLKGKVQRLSPQTGNPAIIAELSGNRVNVDDLRAVYSLIGDPNTEGAQSHDLNAKVKAELLEAELETGEITARNVDAHIRVQGGDISIQQFNAEDFFGLKVSSLGRIEDVLSKPNGNMKFNVFGEKGGEFLEFLKRFTGENHFLDALLKDPSLTANSSLMLELDTRARENGAKGQLLATGLMGSSKLDLTLGFSGDILKPSTMELTLDLALENPFPTVLMRQLGLDALPSDLFGGVGGPLKLNVDLNGVAREQMNAVLSANTPDTILSAQGDFKTPDWNNFDSNMNVTVASDDLAPLLLMSGARFPGLNLTDPLLVSGKFKFSSSEGQYGFSDLDGQVNGNGFQGDLGLQRKGLVRPKLTGRLSIDKADLPLLAESVLGVTTTTQDSGLKASDQNFGEAYFPGLDGNIQLKAQEFALDDSILGRDASAELVMLEGALDVNSLEMTLFGGQARGSLNLKNNQGVVLAKFQYDVENAQGTELARRLKFGEFASGQVTLNGSLETSGRSRSALVSNMSGNGILDLKNLSVEGLYPDNLDPIMLETGAEDYEIKSDRIADLVRDNLLINRFSLSEIEVPFSINGGRMRVRNLAQSFGNTRMIGNMEADLSSRDIVADLKLIFDPGRREQISGVEPQLSFKWTGSVQDPDLRIETDQLESYLSLRAFEQSQRRVETLEAQVIEKQRMQRHIAFAFAREKYVERKNEEELRRQELERLRLEEEARAAEEARLKQEEEERQRQEELARLEAERIKQEELARQEERKKAS